MPPQKVRQILIASGFTLKIEEVGPDLGITPLISAEMRTPNGIAYLLIHFGIIGRKYFVTQVEFALEHSTPRELFTFLEKNLGLPFPKVPLSEHWNIKWCSPVEDCQSSPQERPFIRESNYGVTLEAGREFSAKVNDKKKIAMADEMANAALFGLRAPYLATISPPTIRGIYPWMKVGEAYELLAKQNRDGIAVSGDDDICKEISYDLANFHRLSKGYSIKTECSITLTEAVAESGRKTKTEVTFIVGVPEPVVQTVTYYAWENYSYEAFERQAEAAFGQPAMIDKNRAIWCGSAHAGPCAWDLAEITVALDGNRPFARVTR